jgi:hypothetical protein
MTGTAQAYAAALAPHRVNHLMPWLGRQGMFGVADAMPWWPWIEGDL